MVGDVADLQTAQRVVASAVSSFGGVDYLLSKAGVFYTEDVLGAPVEHLDRFLSVNVRSNHLTAAEAARAMVPFNRGVIMITASAASVLGDERIVADNVSKAAIRSFARSLSIPLRT